jgi:TonB family protein
MRRIALRLVVALLTFVGGVTVSSLLTFNSSHKSERCVAPAPAAVLVASPSLDEPPPPPVWRKSVVDGGILNGKAVSKPAPVYPPIAKAAHAEGTVVVRVLVDEDGKVISASASSGHPLLQQAAVAAARQALFTPTRINGEPVKVAGDLTYNFMLQ